MIIRFTFALLSISCTISSLVAAEQPDHVFLMIGQSNMAGRAKMLEEDKNPLEGVQLLNADSKWEQAANPLNRYAALRRAFYAKNWSQCGVWAGDGFSF